MYRYTHRCCVYLFWFDFFFTYIDSVLSWFESFLPFDFFCFIPVRINSVLHSILIRHDTNHGFLLIDSVPFYRSTLYYTSFCFILRRIASLSLSKYLFSNRCLVHMHPLPVMHHHWVVLWQRTQRAHQANAALGACVGKWTPFFSLVMIMITVIPPLFRAMQSAAYVTAGSAVSLFFALQLRIGAEAQRHMRVACLLTNLLLIQSL